MWRALEKHKYKKNTKTKKRESGDGQKKEKEKKKKEEEEGGGGETAADDEAFTSTTSSVAPLPFVLLPTTRLGQIGLFFFFFFIQLYCKNWILFFVLFLDYLRRFLRVKQRD